MYIDLRAPLAPQGVTVALVLAESHLMVNTWPEKGVLQPRHKVELFACTEGDQLHLHRQINRKNWKVSRGTILAPSGYMLLIMNRRLNSAGSMTYLASELIVGYL